MNHDHKEILLNASFFFVIRFLGLFLGYVFTYFITKHYGAETFGLLSISFSLFYIFGILGRMGIDMNIVKFYSIDENAQEYGLFYAVLLKSFLISSLIAIALFISQDLFIYYIFHKPNLKNYIFWTSLSIPFWSIVLICAGLLRAKKKNSWFAFLNNPGKFLFNILAFLFLIRLIDSPLTSVISHFSGIVILSALSLFIVFRHAKIITFSTKHNSWQFLKDAFPMMLSSTILILMGWLDTFILGIFETSKNIGIYNVALKLSALTGFSLNAINSILAPKVAKLFNSGGKKELRTLVKFTTAINFYITLFVVLFILFFHTELLLFFGDDFLSGNTILIILCLGQVVNSLAGSVGIILQMTGNQKVFQNTLLAALVVNISLNFFLIPFFGGIGAAIATVASMSCWNIAGSIYLKHKLSITTYYRF